MLLALLGQLILLQCEGASFGGALVVSWPDGGRGEITADPHAEQITRGRMTTRLPGALSVLARRARGR